MCVFSREVLVMELYMHLHRVFDITQMSVGTLCPTVEITEGADKIRCSESKE